MKRRHRNKKRSTRVIRLWTQEEAEKVIPYLRSVMGSLREQWLKVQSAKREAALLSARQHPLKRDQILTQQFLAADQGQAEDRFDDALAELAGVDVFLLDPVKGLALIPFRKDDELAWFVFDQFDQRGVSAWRFHQDSLDQRRPLALLADTDVA
jgi:hypothetical protein